MRSSPRARRGGYSKDIKTWGDLGLKGDWAAKPISLYGRNSASGTYGYFKEHALFNGDYKDTVKEQPGSSSVVQGVASDRYAIGYSGIGYKTADVRAVPLEKAEGDACHPADEQNVYSGEYPLCALPPAATSTASPASRWTLCAHEFLEFVLSKEGQEIVVKDGYLPLTKKLVDEELAKLK